MTALATKPLTASSIAERLSTNNREEQHFLLADISWKSYVAIGKALADRPALRLTYDRGSLEFMTTSRKHEFFKKWLNRMIEIIAEELNRPIAPGGNMTFQREDLHRGLEGDECFWIEHEAHMRRKLTWDPESDPPPDLFLEIEVTRSLLNRIEMLAALRVAEVWVFDGISIRVLRLQADGTYQVQERSVVFPEVPMSELARFLDPPGSTDYLTAMREFRECLRQALGKPPKE